MKLLVAVIGPEDPKPLVNKTLSWAPRAGYNMRIFITSETEIDGYLKLIDHINYQEYLDLRYSMVVVGQDPEAYARKEEYDLLLILPPDLVAWNNARNRDRMIIDYAVDVGEARLNLVDASPGEITHFENGTILKKL